MIAKLIKSKVAIACALVLLGMVLGGSISGAFSSGAQAQAELEEVRERSRSNLAKVRRDLADSNRLVDEVQAGRAEAEHALNAVCIDFHGIMLLLHNVEIQKGPVWQSWLETGLEHCRGRFQTDPVE